MRQVLNGSVTSNQLLSFASRGSLIDQSGDARRGERRESEEVKHGHGQVKERCLQDSCVSGAAVGEQTR